MKKTIWLVDDETEVAEVMEHWLSMQGFEVRVFTDSTQAHDALIDPKAELPDLVMTDFNMPRLDGLQFVQSLKENGVKVPLVWLSAYSSEKVHAEAVRHGVLECFSKPVSFSVFIERIEFHLRKESSRKKAG